MITDLSPTYSISDECFDQLNEVIERSETAEIIDDFTRRDGSAGGRHPVGIRYTTAAVLTALAVLVWLGRTPSLRNALAQILDFSPRQRAAVGMSDVGPEDIAEARADSGRAYAKFHAWWTRRCLGFDAGFDLPARRVTNATHLQMLAARSDDERERSDVAAERARRVVNALVAASVLDAAPKGYEGDLVVDETTFDLAKPSRGLGTRPEKFRAAAYMGRYYVRDDGVIVDRPTGSTNVTKRGFGVGVTAITRIGPPAAIYAIPPVITALVVRHPTSGSVDGLRQCLDYHRANGFEGRRTGRSRLPCLTVDRGYNVKDGFAELMLDRGYCAVARYPQKWGLVSQAVGGDGRVLGPIHAHGTLYCPAAAKLVADPLVMESRTLLMSDGGFDAHDRRLASALPFLMGTNSRPYFARPTRGRPPAGQPVEPVVKLEVVCPAVQLRCKCPLKPDSLVATPVDAPTAHPTWNASEYLVCSQSSVTVTYTPDQLKRAQFGLVPGSWEHMLQYESARSLTERQFGFLKSRHITGVERLSWAPRREPTLQLIVALAAVVANVRAQRGRRELNDAGGSIARKWQQIERDIGRPPFRTPPRT